MSDQKGKAFEVKWRIENLKSWFQTRHDPLYSHTFLAKPLTNTRWKLRLSQNFHQATKYISFAIERDVEDEHPQWIAVNYELSFLACDGSCLKSKSRTAKFASKTVSQELNVKEVEILEEKAGEESYLPEGVLTICCKLWNSCSRLKGGQCSIRSVIGKKCVTLNGTIEDCNRLINSTTVTTNFISPSSEISFISFAVGLTPSHPYSNMNLEKLKVECKSFNFHLLKLFLFDANGKRKEIYKSNNLTSLLFSNKPCSFQTQESFSRYVNYFQGYLINDTLKLQLEITYYPGVESECIEYEEENYTKSSDESIDIENVNSPNLEKGHSYPLDCLHLSGHGGETSDIEKNVSSDEDESSDAAGTKKLPSTTLKEDLTSLYNDRLFCDTKFVTNTETFPAHRNVLSARSPVFKKMFTTDMKEKSGECINVPDISSDTMHRMLQFLYTDSTGDLEMQSAKDLYIASDKYDIASLKQRCSSFMTRNLCPANVCDVLVLADLHQDKNLESSALEYVLTNDEEVFHSEEWNMFMKNYSSLAAQVMYLKFTKK
ncbi:unnamed protein product [Larinioides sclopetarius]|uniref:BTB domain-containing protein n=1 Tax=Larinioides sclopetarius TaxID=280406 RepID=A0AAV2AE14_9ARAC